MPTLSDLELFQSKERLFVLLFCRANLFGCYDVVHYRIQHQGSRRVYVDFLGYVFAVSGNGVCRYAKTVVGFFVTHSHGNTAYNFFLSFAQSAISLLRESLIELSASRGFNSLDLLDKKSSLHLAMAGQILLQHKDVVKKRI